MPLTSLLPIGLTDDLCVVAERGAAGQTLTPAQAMALGERMIHQGARRAAELRKMQALGDQAKRTGRNCT